MVIWKKSRVVGTRPVGPRWRSKSEVRSVARVSSWLELAASDEKDLSTAQPSAKTDSRLSGPYGQPRRTQGNQTTPQQGPQTSGHLDSAETTRVATPSASASTTCGSVTTWRLHRRAEFIRVQRQGIRFQTAHFAVYLCHFPEEQAVQLGMTVPRRIGKAVVRNRVKRRIRECFRRQLRATLPAGAVIVVIARTGAQELGTLAIVRELTAAAGALCRRLGS
jgi:ribonuclease P protein component